MYVCACVCVCVCCVHACVCVHVCMQLQIIYITHCDMYYFGLIGPHQCSVAYVQCRYDLHVHVCRTGVVNPKCLGYSSLSVCLSFTVCIDPVLICPYEREH